MTRQPEPEPKLVWAEALQPAAETYDLEDVATFGQNTSDNLVIQGDVRHALDALTHQPRYSWRYSGKVALAYLDPPFNAGNDYPHYRDSLSRSAWLNLIRDTLLGVKQVLAADGSVWVHLNDAAQHLARCVLDEIFGPENFVATIIWHKTPGPRPNGKPIAISHEYIHVYRKTRLLKLTGRLDTLWTYRDVGAGQTASAESRQLFPEPFSTPKPEQLLARIIDATSDPGDLVLECFAGSGTAAAVANKLGRRWVAIEAQENTVTNFLLPRLKQTIAGANAVGISSATSWDGGGGFVVSRVIVGTPT